MDCIVQGILQERILAWVAFPFSRGSSQPRDWTQVSCIAGGFFTNWVTREALYIYVYVSSVVKRNLRQRTSTVHHQRREKGKTQTQEASREQSKRELKTHPIRCFSPHVPNIVSLLCSYELGYGLLNTRLSLPTQRFLHHVLVELAVV